MDTTVRHLQCDSVHVRINVNGGQAVMLSVSEAGKWGYGGQGGEAQVRCFARPLTDF